MQKHLKLLLKNGIKTVGIQHGVIPSDYADYIFEEINKFQSTSEI